VGYYNYDDGQVIPLYLQYKYSTYLKNITPYFFGDGGIMLNISEFEKGSKIFINPGIGFSRAVSSKLEFFLGAGLMIQTRSDNVRSNYINFKLGIAYRKNSFRLFKPE